VPDIRRSPFATTPVGSPAIPAPKDPRESSPPEGTPMRHASHSQVMAKAVADDEPSELAPLVSELAPLVAVLAHDLNNLLQIISTTAQLLRMRESNKESQQFLGDISHATDRAARLSSRMLEAAVQERRRSEQNSKP
jgi:signal transduction histidine kinase